MQKHVQEPEIPDIATLSELINSFAGRESEAIYALQKHGARIWTYEQLYDDVLALARGLSNLGVQKVDQIALVAFNRTEAILAALAILKTGAAVVPIDAQLGTQTLEFILRDCQARIVFVTEDYLSRFEVLTSSRNLQLILLDGDEANPRHWHQLLVNKDVVLPEINPDDPAALFYTSGTTGRPKGVPLTHANIVFSLNGLFQTRATGVADRLLLPLPLHHVFPFVCGMLFPLALGFTVVLPHALTGPQIVRALQEGKVTIIVGVPRLYDAFYTAIVARVHALGKPAYTFFYSLLKLSIYLRRIFGWHLGQWIFRPMHRRFAPTLRLTVCGGAALNPDLAWKLEGLGWWLMIGYGMTETAPNISYDHPDSLRIGSVGKPFPGLHVRIAPFADMDKKDEAYGEVQVRGPNVFAGYHHLPEETTKAFTDDGWFRTGDLGRFDADGYLILFGRASTLIVTEGGENVQPEDVEEIYQRHPVIREIGILAQEGRLTAVIVPEMREVRQRDSDIESAVRETLMSTAHELPSYQRISDYVITREPLPRTRLGKLQRHRLKERYRRMKSSSESTETMAEILVLEELAEQDRALFDDPTANKVWEWLTARYAPRHLTLNTSPQLDLGIDSIEWLNVTLEIGERTGIDLSEEAINRIDTLRDLLREVSEASVAKSAATPLDHPEEFLSPQQKRWLRLHGSFLSYVARGLYALNRWMMQRFFRVRVEGLEHVPNESQFVLISNHASYLDPFVLAAVLDYRRLQRTYWAGFTGAAFRNWLFRLMSRIAQVVPIDPESKAISSLAFGSAVVRRGGNLIWFPEGSRSATGRLQPFRPGIGMILSRCPVTVVPAVILGAYESLPVGATLPRFRSITVVFGPPLQPQDLAHQGIGANPEECIIHGLEDAVSKLLGNDPKSRF
jgi:long-chain acyl-CoA synthetase